MSGETQRTLLLVEDEAIIAMGEKSTLEKNGYRVLLALSGDEAVAAVRADPGIDLILMDIDLGRGMDGTEAAALILKQRDVPVLFLSSHMEPEVVAKTEKITSYGYVVKHSTATVLDASIKMAFKLFAAKKKRRKRKRRCAGARRSTTRCSARCWTVSPCTRSSATPLAPLSITVSWRLTRRSSA